MHLNTLAGRSYNDLMQYPVFPWVIADYDSSQLDLSQPSTFRDLSKTMGSQTPDRLKQFQKRYNEWDDPQGENLCDVLILFYHHVIGKKAIECNKPLYVTAATELFQPTA
jgi:hypothetical protein